MTYPERASSETSSQVAPPQLHVGDAPVDTDSAPALAAIAQWQLLKITATGVTPVVAGDVSGSFAPAAGVGFALSQIAVASGERCPYWKSGTFNHLLITWPSTLDTYAKRKAFLAGSNLQIGHTNPETLD